MSWPPSEDSLRELLDEACTDAYGDEEQLDCIASAVEMHRLSRPVQVSGRAAVLVGIDVGRTLLAEITLGETRLRVPHEDIRPAAASPFARLVSALRSAPAAPTPCPSGGANVHLLAAPDGSVLTDRCG